MSAPYTANTVEEQLARVKALLSVVESVLDRNDRGALESDLKDGADICLAQAIDIIDAMRVGLPSRALNAKISEAELAGTAR